MSEVTPTFCQVIKLWWLGKRLKNAFETSSDHLHTTIYHELKETEVKYKLHKASSAYWDYYQTLDKRSE